MLTPTTIDRFFPASLGFDRFFNMLEGFDALPSVKETFPPANIVKESDNKYILELAVAGYKDDEISVEVENNRLLITGTKSEADEKKGRNYLVKGIAGRSFMRSFYLADTLMVKEAKLKDGVLTVELENIVPEARKSRKIPLIKQ